MTYSANSLEGFAVTLDDEQALPVSLGSIRKRLSLATRDFDDVLTDLALEVTEQLEGDISSFLRPATVVQNFDWLFGVTTYPQVYYLGGYTSWPRQLQPPFDLKLARYPYSNDQPLTVQYLDADDNTQSYTGFEVHDSSTPTTLRFLDPLPDVKINATKAWTLTYRSYYEKVPMVAKKAIIQATVDAYEHRGIDRHDDLGWQKAVRLLTWGPL